MENSDIIKLNNIRNDILNSSYIISNKLKKEFDQLLQKYDIILDGTDLHVYNDTFKFGLIFPSKRTQFNIFLNIVAKRIQMHKERKAKMIKNCSFLIAGSAVALVVYILLNKKN